MRIHYIITDGGKAPNIVPEEAEVYYFIRAAKPDYLAEVVERVAQSGRRRGHDDRDKGRDPL